MSTPTAKPDESAIDAAGRPAPGKVLGAVVDAIGAAHMTAGLMLALAIAGSLALGLGDAWGGALFLTGGVPASLASAVEAMRNEPWTDSGASLRGIGSMVRYAQANRDYFARMMVAQLLAAGVNVALGYALRRRLPQARWAEQWFSMLAAVLILVHGLAVVRLNPPSEVLAVFVAAPAAAVALWVVMTLPAARDLFARAPRPAALRRRGPRHWAALSIQLLSGLLMFALAGGILLLWLLGPLVEAAWLVVWSIHG